MKFTRLIGKKTSPLWLTTIYQTNRERFSFFFLCIRKIFFLRSYKFSLHKDAEGFNLLVNSWKNEFNIPTINKISTVNDNSTLIRRIKFLIMLFVNVKSFYISGKLLYVLTLVAGGWVSPLPP